MRGAGMHLESPGAVRGAVGAMGTRFEFVIAELDERRGRSLASPEGRRHARALVESAVAIVCDWHERLSVFEAGSLVSRINQSGGARDGAWVGIDRDFQELLEACERVREASGGAFDVCIGGGIEIDPSACAVRLIGEGASLDFGAVAKGHALDLVASLLRSEGVTSAIMHGGTSSARAIGSPPTGGSWMVGLAGDAGGTRIALDNRAMSVSASSGRVLDGAGHVLDPRAGVAAPLGRRALCVGASALLCDAWATAMVVLGRDGVALTPKGLRASVWIEGSSGVSPDVAIADGVT